MTATTVLSPTTDPRAYLRALAESAQDAYLLSTCVRLATSALPNLTRAVLWPQLVEAVNLLADVQAGSVDWREVVPHARPSEGVTLAVEELERQIGALLDELTATERAA